MGRRKTGKRRQTDIALGQNRDAFNKYYYILLELATNLFDWKNLPDTVNERFLELVLFQEGSILFFNEDGLNRKVVMRYNLEGELDIYGEPMKRHAYSSYNGYNAHLDDKNSVIIWNNTLHTGNTYEILDFAQRLWDLDRTIDVNAKAQKTPILLLANENEKLTLLNMYEQYEGNTPVIHAKKSINPEDLTVLKTDAPFVADKLFDLKQQIWNEALTFIGIPNLNIGKKERLVQDEVSTNNGCTTGVLFEKLRERKQACERINKMFGTNIDVELRENYMSSVSNVEDNQQFSKEGEE